MDHHLDPVVVDAEEPVRLDQLESLVRERGLPIDRPRHAPRRCASASDGVTPARSAGSPAERLADAVSTELHDRLRVAASRHCSSAECSLSTGQRALHPAPGLRSRARRP